MGADNIVRALEKIEAYEQALRHVAAELDKMVRQVEHPGAGSTQHREPMRNLARGIYETLGRHHA